MTRGARRHGGATSPAQTAAFPSSRAAQIRTRAAAIGLVCVLMSLTTFSMTAAVTNARAAQEAQRSAVLSGLSERAGEALLQQEDLADEFAADGDPEIRAQYDAARTEVRTALTALRRAAPARATEIDGRLLEHARYGLAVEQLFALGAASPSEKEAFEERVVDPFFDPLAEALQADLKEHYHAAGEALASVGRSQELLLVVTPAVFGTGLVLLTGFTVVLGRHRRRVLVQAEENRHQADHDSLTGLPNRALLHVRSAGALAGAQASGTSMALMLLDVDRFKEINDTLGHHYGDLVLQALAERLLGAVRSTDTIARLGGDEFAVLLPSVGDAETALRVAGDIAAAMEASVEAGGLSLDVDTSIGIALLGEHGQDVETLLQHADIAMYRAKARGLGVCVYDPAFNDHSREQLGLLGDLRRGLDNGELVLHFQPKVTLPDLAFCGAEALVRWEHPQRGLVAPGMFVPAAERTALIRPLTRYVLDAALRECRRWLDSGRHLQVAVNVSARNLLDDGFATDVLELLEHWQVPPPCLQLEVTESSIMLDPERAKAVLLRFSGLGIDLAIDDFGAGYTSMAHLRNLPVSELKIDRSLVAQMDTVESDALIVRAMIDLSRSLGLRTVAEGVEDEATLQRLIALGCDVVQGYHLSHPLPADELMAWHDAASSPIRA